MAKQCIARSHELPFQDLSGPTSYFKNLPVVGSYIDSFGQLPLPIALSMIMGSFSLLGLAMDLDLGPMDVKIFGGGQ